MDKKNMRKRKIRNGILFALYMVVLVYLLFFSDTYGRTVLYDEYQYNLVPFKEINLFRSLLGGKYWRLYLINVLGNIAIFIPFGYLVPGIFEKKSFFTITLGLLFSLTIETVQLFTRVGVFDVDDIILNTIGVILGVLFWKLERVLVKKRMAGLKTVR